MTKVGKNKEGIMYNEQQRLRELRATKRLQTRNEIEMEGIQLGR
jgi:hypothetical protein